MEELRGQNKGKTTQEKIDRSHHKEWEDRIDIWSIAELEKLLDDPEVQAMRTRINCGSKKESLSSKEMG